MNLKGDFCCNNKRVWDTEKGFEVQVGPDRGHTAVLTERMMEFFIQNLVLNR